MSSRFSNRSEAGKALAKRLKHYAYHPDVVVLALPRGGVPVGFEIARELHSPLRVFVVRKLGVPGHEEFAMGAIASGGAAFLNRSTVEQLGISETEIEAVMDRESQEIARREREYGSNEKLTLRDHTIILTDDGLATGSTMHAAVKAVREQKPHKIIVAIPVAPREVYSEFRNEVDEVIAVMLPQMFFAVGEWYEDFSQTTDDEVRELLGRAANDAVGSTPVIL